MKDFPKNFSLFGIIVFAPKSLITSFTEIQLIFCTLITRLATTSGGGGRQQRSFLTLLNANF